MIDDCDLVGIRSQGVRFTWVRGRSNHTRVERRLDRVLVSNGCISYWREILCVVLPRICSDHCPLLVRLSDFEVSTHRPFRFQSMWLEHPDFIAIVRRIWSSLIVGSPPHVVIYKLRNLKKALKSWNWEVFRDLNSAIARKFAELHSIQLDLSNWGFSDDLFIAETSVHSELDVLLRRHECFYRDQSRVRWLRDEDRNTSFFHAFIKRRQYRNTISTLSINRVLSEDQPTIKDHIISYYSGLFSSDVSRVGRDLFIVDDMIPSLVTAVENAFLTSVPSADDIHDAASAPGPDEFSSSFYQRCWDVVGSDVVLAVQDFFITGVVFPDGILRSSRLSILFNGVPEEYFCCSRRVRQGDPLSPLLFGIAEDFLSRLLTRLVGSSQILPISSPRGFLAPTHVLYADDVLIFCRDTQKNLKHIMGAFRDYGDISGQLVNLVPLFRGKPRKVVLRPIADKILSKFGKWKGKSLSLAGHATLIRSVITGSFVHSFMIYKRPSSLLSLINRKLKNLLWTGSYLRLLNDSLLRKFTWKFITTDGFAFSFLRERYLKHLQKLHGGYVTSSIWSSLWTNYSSLLKEGIWLIGENSQRDFWRDNLLGIPIMELLGIPDYLANLSGQGSQILFIRILWFGLILGMVMFLTRLLIPSFSVIFLRLPTEDLLCRSGFQLASCCSICGVSSEFADHLFLHCPLAVTLWEAVFSAFQ
ncbi:hypothetical protein LWI28_019580 [Acer negundo]|uniref:Reverse transcriptase domain-containing protein n=1 Tax=Acer negundo TaxID=4023 RepID=A0AAD5JUC4_ACENE|nr:hypothetical protein LWI28_019580 [Acer negundo]